MVSKLNDKNKKTKTQKMSKRLKHHFTKDDIWVANKHIKRWSTLLVISKLNHNEMPLHAYQNRFLKNFN